MASSFSTLGIELIATGEASGLWGDKTNVNLQMFQEITSGYVAKSIAGSAATTALSITNATTGSDARQAVIELTGTITGNQIVTVPDSLEKVYIVKNSTSGAHTVQFKTASGTGVTFGASDKGTRLVFADGTNIVDAGGSVGAQDLNGESLTLDADADTTITADTDDQIDIAIAGADDFRFTANTFTALSGSGVVIPDSGLTLGSTAVTSTAAELNILDGVTSTTAELNILDGVTSTTAELNVLDGITAVVGELNALDLGSTAVGTAVASKAVILDSNKDYTGIRNFTLTGDLTVGGDDITMGTNTAGNLLIADGTNFNSIAVGSLSEISTVANDDVFLAVDTSGGGLKKIARSAVVSGLATSAAISNVVEDTTPQLGGDLDMNGQDIVTTSNADLELAPNGTGHVTVKGNTNSGAIQFNCEQNSHGQIIQGAAHSAGATNTLTIPSTGGNSTIVSDASTSTLTNKTLTTPQIAEIDSLSSGSITLDSEVDIILDADGADVILKDAGTTYGSLTNSSGNLIIKSGTTTAATFSGANVTLAGTVQGTTITATTAFVPDASDGAALGTSSLEFSDLFLADAAVINLGDDQDVTLTHVADTGILLNAASVIQFRDSGLTIGSNADGDLDIVSDGTAVDSINVESAGGITLDAGTAGSGIIYEDDGTEMMRIHNSSSDVIIESKVSDKDIIIKGNDGGSVVSALTLDMSAAGAASFNAGVTANGGIETKNGATGAGFVKFFEDSDNGTNAITLQGPASTGDVTFTLPSADGSNGQALTTNGSGTLAFASVSADLTSVESNIVPDTSDSRDLGTSSKVWRNIYTGDLHLSNESKSEGNSVDGTKGNWTIQEGANDLYLLNNKSSKKYKFKLEEI